MRLQKINIERRQWGQDKGKLLGSITFSDSDAETTLRLSEEKANEFLALCAEALVENAKEMSQIMVSRLLNQPPAITDQSKAGE